MAIYTNNRMGESRFGAGLPFYNNVENQERFAANLYVYGNIGLWTCPSNRLPTWQIRCPAAISTVELVPVDGLVDSVAFALDISNIETRAALDDGTPFIIAFTQEVTRSFTLFGTYYFRLTFVNGAIWYSEIFNAGGCCGAKTDLTANVVKVNMDDTVDIDFVFTAEAQNISAATATILGTDYGVGAFTVLGVPVGVSVFTTNIETENCGTFLDTYTFNNLGAGVTTYTKEYL